MRSYLVFTANLAKTNLNADNKNVIGVNATLSKPFSENSLPMCLR